MNKNLESTPKPVLSLCMIVKNEIKNLPRCLASVKPYVDEMIIVDTGSEDGTPEIALKSGAKVKNFEWCDDFAAARNYTISQASGDWILMLDADEELVVESEYFLERITSQPEILAYSLTYIEVNDQEEFTPSYRFSLFRNISDFRYVGRFHEILTYQNQECRVTQSSHLENLKILHYGFGKSQILQKNLSRNIPILERIRQSEGLSLKLLYCLAQMYSDTQQQELCQECYAEIFERLLPNLLGGNPPEEFGFVISMIYSLGVQSLVQKDYETARLLAQRGLEWRPNSPEMNYLAGATLRELGFLVGAVAYFEKCIQLGREGNYYKVEPVPLELMTTYPAYDLGCLYIALNRAQSALAAFELALSFDANFMLAQSQIDRIRQIAATTVTDTLEKSLESLPKPVLSLCMIVKNEIKNLPRCLASVKPYVDEMIVVDTGSQDGTPEIALKSGAKVKNFEWCDDFAAARNYAISQASGDWILMLDADEELVIMSDDFLAEINLQPEIIAYLLTYTEVNDQPELTPLYRISLFRNIPGVSYVGRFHEKLKYQNQDYRENQLSHLKSIRILHYGFSKSHQRQKNIRRDIPMLERIRRESGLCLRLLYSLAELYRTTQQPEKSQSCYAEAFERLLPHLMSGNKPEPFDFVPSLIYSLGIQSLTQNDYETATLLCQRGLEWCPNYPALNYLAGTTLRELGFTLGAIAYFKNCIHLGQEDSYYKGNPFDVSFITTYPAYGLGLAYIGMERLQDALAAFELALSFDANFTAAQEQIDTIRQVLAT